MVAQLHVLMKSGTLCVPIHELPRIDSWSRPEGSRALWTRMLECIEELAPAHFLTPREKWLLWLISQISLYKTRKRPWEIWVRDYVVASTFSKSFSASTLTHLAVVSKSTQESVSPLGHKNRRLAGRKKFD